MRVQVGCEFSYHAEVATHAVIQVEPRLDGGVRALDERWATTPQIGMSRYVDGYGNMCRRATMCPGVWSLRYDALLEVPDSSDAQCLHAVELAPEHIPGEVLVYTLPSRFCPSQELANDAWTLFGASPPGWRRVQAICDWVNSEVRFGYLSTSPLATAVEVFNSRAGVCRDFAHLAVTFCRALNIPARYVFGYLPDIDVPPAAQPMGLPRLDRGLPGRRVVDVRSPQQPETGRPSPHRAGARRPRRRDDLYLRRARAHIHERVGRSGDLVTAAFPEHAPHPPAPPPVAHPGRLNRPTPPGLSSSERPPRDKRAAMGRVALLSLHASAGPVIIPGSVRTDGTASSQRALWRSLDIGTGSTRRTRE